MKTLICFLIVVTGFSFSVPSEAFNKTPADLDTASSRAQVMRQAELSAVEVRAGEYRQLYQVYDEHHNNAAKDDNVGGPREAFKPMIQFPLC